MELSEIKLTKGRVAIVDKEDFEWLSQWKWTFGRYALRRIGGRKNYTTIYMHKLILGISGNIQGDHINNNKLDNRRSNLRVCNHAENQRNRPKYKNNVSGFRGVCLDKRRNLWKAEICFNRKRRHLGYFDNKEDAAKRYDEYAKELFGEFAYTNFI